MMIITLTLLNCISMAALFNLAIARSQGCRLQALHILR
jgi:hypothetical protein